jgi:hypothetical protein
MEWLALLLFLAWQAGDGDVVTGASDLLDQFTRGQPLTGASYDLATGVVPYDPNALAAQVGCTLDQLAMSRMLSSEEGQSDNTTKAACAWCLVNHAGQVGESVSAVLLAAVDPAHAGYFGTFKNIDKSSPYYTVNSAGKPNKADRYASTALDSYNGDLQIAIAVLTNQIADFTNGATQFDRPAGENNPDAVAAKRIAAGSESVTVPGVDPGLRFWRPA